MHHHTRNHSAVSISMLRLVSVRPQNEGITALRSASSCAHDSSFSASSPKSRYDLVKTNTR